MTTVIENGKFVVDETKYSRLTFKAPISLPKEIREKHDEMNKLERDAQKLRDEIKDYVVRDFHPQALPKAFVVNKVDIDRSGVNVVWGTGGSITVHRLQKNNPETPPKKRTVYEELSLRHDFKQILSSGILSKSERRKCLGLPPLPDNDSDE